MQSLFHKIALFLLTPLLFSLSLAGHPVPAAPSSQALGASNPIETPIALFQTSLANGITAAATTMTLVSATTGDGTSLASSTYSFIIDEGTASAEFVKADCTGTSCTNMMRGISQVTGTSSIISLAKAHRRGASVKITDAPLLLNLTNILNGIGRFPNKIGYATEPTFNVGTDIIDKTYADGIATAGCANADDTTRGCVEMSTSAEAALGTSLGGSGARLALGANIATSTCQILQSSVIVASSTTGKLDKNCFDQTARYTFTGSNTFTGSTTLAATTTIAASTSTKLTLNGIPLAFPFLQGTASSTLVNDGAGNLSWKSIYPFSLSVSTSATSTSLTSYLAIDNPTTILTATVSGTGSLRLLLTYAGGATNSNNSGGGCVDVTIDGSNNFSGACFLNGGAISTGVSNVSFSYLTGPLTPGSHAIVFRMKAIAAGQLSLQGGQIGIVEIK